MKHIFTFFSIFFVFNCFGQFSHTPNPVEIIAPVDSLITKQKIEITISADTNYMIHWQLFKDPATWKSGWATQVCDLNLCYLENVDKNPKGIPNDARKGTGAWYVYFIPNQIPGDSEMELVLYGDADHTVELYRIPIIVHATTSSKTTNIKIKNDIVLYPNPAQDYFSISNGNKIDKIKLYNILGTEIKSFYHYNNAQHLIGDLKPGMYLIQMLDKDNNIVKTSKLNKLSSGA